MKAHSSHITLGKPGCESALRRSKSVFFQNKQFLERLE
jgi:hypothetical protein